MEQNATMASPDHSILNRPGFCLSKPGCSSAYVFIGGPTLSIPKSALKKSRHISANTSTQRSRDGLKGPGVFWGTLMSHSTKPKTGFSGRVKASNMSRLDTVLLPLRGNMLKRSARNRRIRPDDDGRDGHRADQTTIEQVSQKPQTSHLVSVHFVISLVAGRANLGAIGKTHGTAMPETAMKLVRLLLETIPSVDTKAACPQLLLTSVATVSQRATQ